MLAATDAFRPRVEKAAGGLGGRDQLLRGAFAHPIRLTVAPDVGRQNRLMPLVDEIAYRLADEVVGDRVTSEAMALQQVPALAHVGFGGARGLHVEVVAPA